jgi:hypothetical protein
MVIEIKLLFFNYPIFFLALVVGFQLPNYNKVWIGQPKILVIEMVIEIKSPFFNSLDFLLVFFPHSQKILAIEMIIQIMLLFSYGPTFFFALMTRFKLLDYDSICAC